MRTARLLARSARLPILVWTALITGLAGATVTTYQHSYPTPQAHASAVAAAQRNPATMLLYGLLPSPGTPAQMFCWEIGTFITILVAVAAVLLVSQLTRGAEQDGTLELIRAAGVRPRGPLLAAAVILAGTAVLLGAGSGAALAASRPFVPSVTWAGCLAFGGVVALTFLAVAASTLVIGQIMPTADSARGAGLALVVAAVAVRAVADRTSIPVLSNLSPLGLRQAVAPFTADRWWVLAAWAAASAGLAGLATALSSQREYGSGLLRPRQRRLRHLHARSPFGLAWRLQRASHLAWAAAVALGALAFTAMGSGLVTSARHGHPMGGFLGTQLAGPDPAVGYLSYLATLVGIAVGVHAIATIGRAARDERGGRTEQLRALGLRAWRPLSGQAGAALAGCLAILVLTAAVVGLAAPHIFTGQDIGAEAVTHLLGQSAAVACLLGLGALVAGWAPRWAGLAWVPFGASVILTLLGPLLKVPGWLIRLSVFGQVHDLAQLGQTLTAAAVLAALALLAALAGLARTGARDYVSG